MIIISIYDPSLETPFRDIGTTLPNRATKDAITAAALDLVESHAKLRTHNTPMQREYRDE